MRSLVENLQNCEKIIEIKLTYPHIIHIISLLYNDEI